MPFLIYGCQALYFFSNALLNKAFRFSKKQRINTYLSKNALKTTAAITRPKNGTQGNP